MVCSKREGGGADYTDIRELLSQGEVPGDVHHSVVAGAEGLEVEGMGKLTGQLDVRHLEEELLVGPGQQLIHVSPADLVPRLT